MVLLHLGQEPVLVDGTVEVAQHFVTRVVTDRTLLYVQAFKSFIIVMIVLLEVQIACFRDDDARRWLELIQDIEQAVFVTSV